MVLGKEKGFDMENFKDLYLIFGCLIILVLFIHQHFKDRTEIQVVNLPNSPANIIKPKIDFAGDYCFPEHKIIRKDLGIFREESISSIQKFIRSIPLSALELHPIFDHTIIGQEGVYKRWWIPNTNDVSIRVEITCMDRKGKVFIDFTKGPSIYSDFVFKGEETLLSKNFYMELDYSKDRTLEFSNEEWLNQKEKPVLAKIKFSQDPAVRDSSRQILSREDDTAYYDYFLFMDRLIKIEKAMGDLGKKEEIIKEYYQREKAAGRFYIEELVEKEPDDKEEVAEEQRRIPESVKREVWRRDAGKCSKCGSRVKLEFDHIVPFSQGGSNTARNVELLCMDCNRKKSARI